NKKTFTYVAPTEEEIKSMQTAAHGKATHNSTSTWINALETFRKDIGLPGKIDDVNSKEELERQLVLFFVSCKQQNGAEYSVQSIKSARFAIARHINTYSKIRPQEITNKNIYSELYNAITGKIKLLTDQVLVEFTGYWFKSAQMGEKSVKGLMKEIATITEIDCDKRKFTNHSGRKTFIQISKSEGISDNDVMSVSRHKNPHSLAYYERPKSILQQNTLSQINSLIYNGKKRIAPVVLM
ncbi:hypothetical protein RhiirA4_412768, partial [Rhizophagus irregularis]